MRFSTLLAAGATVGAMLTTTWVWADTAASPTPDIVRLRSGGFVRGTIVELVPDKTVTVQLPSGELRKFDAAETTYAGPADREGRPPQRGDEGGTRPYATVHAAEAHLRLVGKTADLTFHVQTTTAQLAKMSAIEVQGFERLCTAPCTIDLPAGSHRFAVSRADGAVIAGDGEIAVRGDETVNGAVVDRHGSRVAGILLLSIGLPMSVGAFVGGLVTSENPQSEAPGPLYVTGGVLAAVSLIAGVILVTRTDYATFEVQPGVAALSPVAPVFARREAAAGSAEPAGLTLTVRF